MTAVTIGQGVAGVAVLPLAPALDWQGAWPWLAAGVALHLGYQLALIAAYRLGDLSQVYPIARGTAPALVALASAAVLAEPLSTLQGVAVACVAGGVLALSLLRGAGGDVRAVLFALLTGTMIAGYSMVDGLGARAGGSPLGYFGWLALINAVAFLALASWWRPAVMAPALRDLRGVLGGGGASFAAYAIVVWAFTQAPIALVTALRETSVVFALALGALLLGEGVGPRRIAAAVLVVAGAALLRLA